MTVPHSGPQSYPVDAVNYPWQFCDPPPESWKTPKFQAFQQLYAGWTARVSAIPGWTVQPYESSP